MRAIQELAGHYYVAVADHIRHTYVVVARSFDVHNLDLELRHNSVALGSRQKGFAQDTVLESNFAGVNEKPSMHLGHKEYTRPAADRDKLVYRVGVASTVPADYAAGRDKPVYRVAVASTVPADYAADRDKLVYRVAVASTVPADYAADTGHILTSVAEVDTMGFAVRKEYEKRRYRMEHLEG